MSLALVIFQIFALGRINRKREEEFGSPALYTQEMRQAEKDKGDSATFFRYSV